MRPEQIERVFVASFYKPTDLVQRNCRPQPCLLAEYRDCVVSIVISLGATFSGRFGLALPWCSSGRHLNCRLSDPRFWQETSSELQAAQFPALQAVFQFLLQYAALISPPASDRRRGVC